MSNNTAAYAGGLAAVLAAAFLLMRRNKATGDYLAALQKDGKIGRWNELRTSQPLTVTINAGFSEGQVRDIKAAAEAWSKASGGRLTWHWLPSGSPANITIRPGALGPNQGGWTHCDRDTGDAAREGVMLGAQIVLDMAQIRDFKGVIAHELGHSAGLISHAPASVDSSMHEGGAGLPKDADGKTLRALYGW